MIGRWVQDTELVFDKGAELEAPSLIGTWDAWWEANLGDKRRFNEPVTYLKNRGCSTTRKTITVAGGLTQKVTVWRGVRYAEMNE